MAGISYPKRGLLERRDLCLLLQQMARTRQTDSPVLRLNRDVTSSGAVQFKGLSMQETRATTAQETAESARVTIDTPSGSFVAPPSRRNRNLQSVAFHDRVRLASEEEHARPFLSLTLIDDLRAYSQRTRLLRSHPQKLAEYPAQFLD